MTATLRPFFLASLALAAAIPAASAQELITNVSTLVTTATSTLPTAPAGSDRAKNTFDRGVDQLTGFTTGTGTYTVSGGSDYALVQRNGSTNQSSVWYDKVAGTEFRGEHQDSYGALLRSNNFYEGSDNTFANAPAGAQVGNIERLDYTWRNNLTNLSTLSFAVFDRGAVGVHDAFTIALVTGVDANGKPTAYGAALKVGGNWGGSTNVISAQSYNLFRYSPGTSDANNVQSANSSTESNSQGVGGLVIKVSDFKNLDPNAKVYGYSLMGYDVNTTDLANLVDATGTAYPTNTNSDTGSGGIDLAAVNGLEIRAMSVPEPGVGALCGLGGAALLAGARRRLAQRS